MGTLPYTLINFVKVFKGLSAKARKIMAGPNVIRAYNKEGGYLVTLIKDKKVNTFDL
jgi:hypothetical protein